MATRDNDQLKGKRVKCMILQQLLGREVDGNQVDAAQNSFYFYLPDKKSAIVVHAKRSTKIIFQ